MLSAQAHARPFTRPCTTERRSATPQTRAHRSTPAQLELRCKQICSLPSQARLFATHTRHTQGGFDAGQRSLRCRAQPAALQAAYTVREIRQDDVESVVNLQSKGFYEPWDVGWLDSFFLKLFAADVRAIIKFKLKDPDQSTFRAFVAESNASDGNLSGVVEVSLQSNQEITQAIGAAAGETYAYVACMAVEAATRRQGIAIKLLKAAEQQALKWDQHVAALHVYKTNEIAVKVYEKAGYTPLKEDSRWRTFLGSRQRILMCKNLKPEA
ncbi:hypothetical protein ABBQ32_003511 [Trebouxia sp. C0010 RCD-2024]